MKISQKAISSPLTVFILAIAAAAYGVYAYFNIPLELVPDVNIPWIQVYVPYFGAAPEEVENLIVKPIEDESRGVDNLKHIYSYSSNAGGQIWYEFEINTDTKEARRDLEEIVNRVKHKFPEDAEEPFIRDIDFNDRPIMYVALTSVGEKEFSYEKLKNLADDMTPILEGISGVSRVDVFGGREREFRILVKPEKLQEYGLSIPQVLGAVRGANMNLPAGEVTLDQREYTLRVLGEFNNKKDIERTIVTITPEGPLYIEDIAIVLDTLEETNSFSRYDTRPSVALAIYRKDGANIVGICGEVEKVLEEMKELVPEGVVSEVTFNQADYINENLNQLKTSAIFGAILVIIILILGIGWRNAPLVAAAIPLIILMTFGILYVSGNSLNNISLFSLILLVGIVVDGAVIIVESTYRYLEYGYDKITASRKGVDEVGTAVLASALTTMAAFFPMFMVKGITGEFMRLIPITVIIALSSSILVDHIVIPAVASKMVNLPGKGEKKKSRWFSSRIMKFYRRLLDWALKHRFRIVVITVVALLSSLMLFPFVGIELWPDVVLREFSVNINTPNGTPTERTNYIANRVEALVMQLPDLERYTSSVEGNSANIEIVLVEGTDYDVKEIQEILREKIDSIRTDIADAQIRMRSESMGPLGGAPIQVEIKGEDINVLMDLAFKTKQFLRNLEGTRNVRDDFGSGSPEVRVIIKREQAAFYGVTPYDIVQTIAVAYNGSDVTEVHLEDKEIDVRVEIPEADKTLDVLRRFPIATKTGTTIPLEEVADIDVGSGFARINRVDGKRQVTVEAEVFGVLATEVFSELEPFLDSIQAPGYMVELTGEREQMSEDFSSLGIALVIGAVLVYLVMAIQFQSLSHPFVIMFTIPFALIGVMVGLFITRNHFGVMPLIGMLALIGIVVNDAIVMITYANKLRNEGYPIYQALRRAGPVRLRPILMTSITTMGGLLPLALGLGMEYDFWGPMTWPIIFGLMFSTLLTLLVIPVFYAVINRAGKMPDDLPEINLLDKD
ncbi:MAG: efflux RND transporter permease subunit [bacterium]